MTLARLFAAALVACSLFASAQNQQSQSSRSTSLVEAHAVGPNVVKGAAFFFEWKPAAEATPTETWRIIPNRPPDVHPGYNALDPARLDQYRFDQIKSDPQVRHLKLDALNRDADTTCYAIRSYLVARDSKNSDSTHPAGYSTCLPSDHYQVRSAEMRVVSSDR